MRRSALIVLAALLASSTASAHTLSKSVSSWRFEGNDVRVVARVPTIEIARLQSRAGGRSAAAIAADAELSNWLVKYVVDRLHLDGEAEACAVLSPPRPVADGASRLVLRWTVRCPSAPDPVVRSDLFVDTAPAHLHALAITAAGETRETVLSADRRRFDARHDAAPSEGGAGFWSFVRIGALHVAEGLDHIAFVVALMLLAAGLWQAVAIATGFTLGHSLSLGLAAVGWVSPRGAAVEIMVALSVAYVALECFYRWADALGRRRIFGLNLALHAALAAVGGAIVPWPAIVGSALFTSCHLALGTRRPNATYVRTALALLFGLVHGFAFAGAFAELLANADLISALLGFNLGVELGQLLVLALTLGGLVALQRTAGENARHTAAALVAAVVFAAGLSWTFSRALGV